MKTHKKITIFLITMLTLTSLANFALAIEPTGADTFTYLGNETKSTSATTRTDTRGYIHIINITTNQQTNRWKAYVGNVSGSLVLADSSGDVLYDWGALATSQGEIHATNNSGTVDWANIGCASELNTTNGNITPGGPITQWASFLNHTQADIDRLNNTFVNDSTHPNANLLVGEVQINQNGCFGQNINQTKLAGNFEEVILFDQDDSIVFTSILENSLTGFDLNVYDFQMLVPEVGNAFPSVPTPYYFYIELI